MLLMKLKIVLDMDNQVTDHHHHHQAVVNQQLTKSKIKQVNLHNKQNQQYVNFDNREVSND
jgi:hypothetical protein